MIHLTPWQTENLLLAWLVSGRRFWVLSHWDLGKMIRVRAKEEEEEEVQLRFSRKLRQSKGAKDWLILYKILQSNAACSLMTRDISCNQMRQITFGCRNQPKNFWMPRVNTAPHGGQMENLWGKGRGLELRAEPSLFALGAGIRYWPRLYRRPLIANDMWGQHTIH